ncbi:Catabolic L-serine/threonine dehydratase [Diplodia seriata]|uniref:L-serine ammonia-lyase n=2 Tax=Diplodia seriata TaxID=420778 RepID=A0A1S8BBV5_9PEZI|nr:Catabolic L-serine/threonine dehydratase [Diplodia seriata]
MGSIALTECATAHSSASPPTVCLTPSAKPWNLTPLMESTALSRAAGCCVTAAVTLDRPATVVCPTTTSPHMLAKLRAAGASDVIVHGADLASAGEYLQRHILPRDPNGVYVPPFDHPDIWAGNGSVVHEVAAQLAERGEGRKAPDAVVCSVGGGGLLNGVCGAMDAVGWGRECAVLAMETRGTDSLARALEAGELVALREIGSEARSLGARQVSEETFRLARDPRRDVRSVVLEDREAAMGCWRLADDERLMVELACGVNVALCYDQARLERAVGKKLTRESKVVIVLCGGNDVTVEKLHQWRKEFGDVEKEIPHNADVPSESTAPGHT